MTAMMTAAASGCFAVTLICTGIVAIAVFVLITAIGLAIVSVVPGLGTVFYGTDCNHAAGAVTVAAGMVVSAISLIVVDVISGFRAVF